MFAEDAASGDPKFSQLFATYGTVSDNVIGLVRVDSYLSYENWTKSVD